MGRNTVRIDDQHWIVFGYDPPCNGYFAEYYDINSEIYQDMAGPSEEIGFFTGVSKNRVLDFFEKYNAVEIVKTQRPKAFESLCLDLPC